MIRSFFIKFVCWYYKNSEKIKNIPTDCGLAVQSGNRLIALYFVAVVFFFFTSLGEITGGFYALSVLQIRADSGH